MTHNSSRNVGGRPWQRRTSTRRIYFLVSNTDGIGGIARTVRTLASSLVDRHEVEIISVYRRRQKPSYPLDPRVTVTYLQDARPVKPAPGQAKIKASDLPTAGRVRSWLHQRSSRIATDLDDRLSALTDLLLLRKLSTLPPGVLVSTRPALHAAATRMAPRHVITVGQDHMNFQTRAGNAKVLDMIVRSARRLDAWAVLTQADAQDYAPLLEGSDTVVNALPNASPWPVGDPAPLTSKVVVGAGRLIHRKGYARMVAAWAPVAAAHPDWQLHIYGDGDQRASLERQIAKLGLEGRVLLPGHTTAFEEVLAGASVYAMTSHEEGFPMVLVEAMSKGVPLVSMDCPRGPGEIIVDGHNGRLVPNGDVEGYTKALLEVVGDDALRSRMGAAALQDARQYSTQAVSDRWEELFEQLAAARSR